MQDQPWLSNWENYYEILGVDDPKADEKEIKRAYEYKAWTISDDRLVGAPEHVRRKAEEELKKVNRAYHDVLKDPKKRREYDAEREKRIAEGKDPKPPEGVPKPVVDPEVISFKDVNLGETRKSSFVIRNIGGHYTKIWFSDPDSWVKVLHYESVDPNQRDELPLRVYIEAKGNEWGKSYSEYIRVKLDEQETRVRVDLDTKPKPACSLPKVPTWAKMSALTIVGVIIVVLLATNFWPSPTPILSTTSLANSPWPMFRHEPQHTGRSTYSGPKSPQLKWSFTTGGNIQMSSPAIASDGTIYIGSRDNKLYAINPDGSPKWSYATLGEVFSSPAVEADGTIYVGSVDSKLYAINANGSLKWVYSTGAAVRSSPVVDGDGIIYVGSYDGNLYAINPNGSLKWNYRSGEYIFTSPAIGADGTIYWACAHSLYAQNPDGTLKWSYKPTGYIHSSPASGADGTLYFGCGGGFAQGNPLQNGKLYALNSDGSFKWSYTAGGDIDYSSPAIGSDGTIYIGSVDGKLYAVKPDGSLKWSYTTGAAIYSSPSVGADGTVYVGSNDGRLYAIDSNGSLKWSYLQAGGIVSSPTIGSGGNVHVGAGDGKLYAIGEK